MDLWSQMLLPLMSIRLPASGDVRMNYNPWTNWGWSSNDAGDPEIESEIFANIALPGKQLGKLTDAVMTLIELTREAHPEFYREDSERAATISDVEDLAERILARKKILQGTVEGNAESALSRLKSVNPEAFDRIIEREHKEKTREAETGGGGQ